MWLYISHLMCEKASKNRGWVNSSGSFGFDVLEMGMAQIMDSHLEISHPSKWSICWVHWHHSFNHTQIKAKHAPASKNYQLSFLFLLPTVETVEESEGQEDQDALASACLEVAVACRCLRTGHASSQDFVEDANAQIASSSSFSEVLFPIGVEQHAIDQHFVGPTRCTDFVSRYVCLPQVSRHILLWAAGAPCQTLALNESWVLSSKLWL